MASIAPLIEALWLEDESEVPGLEGVAAEAAGSTLDDAGEVRAVLVGDVSQGFCERGRGLRIVDIEGERARGAVCVVVGEVNALIAAQDGADRDER